MKPVSLQKLSSSAAIGLSFLFALGAAFGSAACTEPMEPDSTETSAVARAADVRSVADTPLLEEGATAVRSTNPGFGTCQINPIGCGDADFEMNPGVAFGDDPWIDPIIFDCDKEIYRRTCSDCGFGGGPNPCCGPGSGSLAPCKVVNCNPDKNGNCPSYP